MKDKSKRLTVVNTDKKKADENASHMLQQKPASALNAAGFNPALYLLKSVWDSVFEIKTDNSGQKYLFGKLPMVTQYGVTMYGDNDELNVSDIYEGLPIDNVTLYWDNGVLKAKGGEGGGGGGVADSIAWVNVHGKPSWVTDTKPIYNYSEIKNTPDLSVFVTGTALSNTLADYATLTYLTGELKKYVTIKDDQDIVGVKNFLNGIKISHMPIRKLQDDVIYIDANLVVRGGVTMYSTNEADIPTIKDEIGFAGYNGSIGLASFDSSQFVISANGTVSVKGGSAGLDTAQLKEYLDSNKYTTETWVKAQGYASASSLSSLQTKVNNFLEGSDTDTIINKWKELEAFLSGLSESDNLATILSTKWTTDNNLISQWNTAYGWGNHASVGYALKSYVDNNFVTLGTKQTITGEKNFTGGLKVNGSPIYYDATNKYWKLEGDLLVTGGVTMYGADEGDLPSILDSLPIASTSSAGIASFDSTYFSVNASGKVTLTSAPSMVSILGSLQDVSSSVSGTTNSDVVLFKSANTSTWVTKPLSEIGGGGSISRPLRWTGYDNGTWDGSSDGLIVIPTSLKNPNALTFTGAVSATYDGSSAVTVNIPTAGGNIDLSNYLPLSGGTITHSNDVGLWLQRTSGSGSLISFKNSSNYGGLFGVIQDSQFTGLSAIVSCQGKRLSVLSTGGVYYQENYGTTPYEILHSGNYSSYALPKKNTSVVWVTNSNKGVVNFKSTAEETGLRLYNGDTNRGGLWYGEDYGIAVFSNSSQKYLGIKNDGTPHYWDKTNSYTLLHTGNYSNYALPKTSYTASDVLAKIKTVDGSGSGLDADLLDGTHKDSFFYAKGTSITSSTINTTLKNGVYYTADYSPVTGAYNYGTLLCFRSGAVGTNSRQTQIYISDGQNSTGGKIYYRDAWNSTSNITSTWYQLARINDNVASATKLQTARTIWGQSFNGTGNVDGSLVVNNSTSNGDLITLKSKASWSGVVYTPSTGISWSVYATNNDNYNFWNSHKNVAVIQISKTGIFKNLGIGDDGRYTSMSNGGFGLHFASGGYAGGLAAYTYNATYLGEVAGVSGGGNTLNYYYYGGTYDSPSLTINTNKYVGIGTTSASTPLHIKKSSTTDGDMIRLDSSAAWSGIVYAAKSGDVWSVNASTANNLNFWNSYLNSEAMVLSRAGNLLVKGGITMYSDIRKKTKLQDVELSLSQIANAPLIQHYYNSDQDKTTHVGSIAQYWAGLNDWFCKLDNEGFYTMEIQNCALASAISIARHLEKYESKTDKKIRQLKKRISQLEDELELLKKGV